MRRLATSITLTTLLLVVCVMPLWVAAAGGCTADNQCTLNSCCPDSATACTFGAPPLDCSTVQCAQTASAPPGCSCDSTSTCQMAWPTTAPPLPPVTLRACTKDSDCVPEQCCHPTTCVLPELRQRCFAPCTGSCEPDTMDCGRGSCLCNLATGKCNVQWANQSSAAPPGPTDPPMPTLRSCTKDSDCVPEQCCHPTTCVLPELQQRCFAPCTGSCEPNTMDCGRGGCACNLATGKCNVQWSDDGNARLPTWLLGLIIGAAACVVLVAGVCVARYVCQRRLRDAKEDTPVVVSAAEPASQQQPRQPAVPFAESIAVDMAPTPSR